MTDFIEGGAMGHTEAHLKELHDFANKYKEAQVRQKEEQDQRRDQLISAFQEHLADVEAMFKLDEDHYRKVHKISEGKFLIIQKKQTRVIVCISTDNSVSLAGHNYKDDITGIEKLEIIDFNTTSKKMETVYVWDKETLIRQLGDNKFYGNATLRIEVQELTNMTTEEKAKRLENANVLINIKQLREEK